MKKITYIILTISLVMVTTIAADEDEKLLESSIHTIGMFKNGLAMVQCSATVDTPGTYIIHSVPEAVHGTFWIESKAKIVASVTTRWHEVEQVHGNMYQELAGHQVEVSLKRESGTTTSIKGVVLEHPEASPTAQPRTSTPGRFQPNWYHAPLPQPASLPRFLILKTDQGIAYIEPSMIAYLEVTDPPIMVREPQSVMVLAISEVPDPNTPILISYLSKGIGWAPNYRLDISDDEIVRVEQTTVIKNELAELNDVELFLITGFPHVQFGHVSSPLTPQTSWADFFRQINTSPTTRTSPHAAITQQVVSTQQWHAADSSSIDLSATPVGEGPDLFYQSAGHHTMRRGDALFLTTGSDSVPYERIVTWSIPDSRDAHGSPPRTPDDSTNAAWDALRFKNPFEFPMTTAPATIVRNGQFLGQQLSYFVNPDETATIPISKALSIRTLHTEHESTEDRTYATSGGRNYRNVLVHGEILISNHRNEQVRMIVRRRFSGDLESAEGEPHCALLEDGIYSVNRRNELVWSLSLAPGEEINMKYAYRVLVLH